MFWLHWANPSWLWILLLFPVLLLWQRWQLQHDRRLPFSSLRHAQKLPNTVFARLRNRYRYGYGLVWLLTALALAGPRTLVQQWPVWDKGIDLIFALDLSESMNTPDLPPSRLAVAKQFLYLLLDTKRQRNDRFGLVIFADEAYTLCPLTVDHAMLKQMLRDANTGAIGNNTAIGDAIATALARFRHTSKRRKVIMLITDGETNAGRIHPLRAVQQAKAMKIPIYSLWLGKRTESSTSPNVSSATPQNTLPRDNSGDSVSNQTTTEHRELDPLPWKALEQISQQSGGHSYALSTPATLHSLFEQWLRQMLPERSQHPRYFSIYQDRFAWFLWPAIGLLVLLIGLEIVVLRSIP